ncbi:MAG: DUF1499 domain-containing protein [Planctomyces sp.]|nr:DUF1499 domain-containing protein [Planctomyces sp.]
MSLMLLIPAIVLIVWMVSMFALSFTAKMPGGLGVQGGRLAECPESPNCVCTQCSSREHWMEPLMYSEDAGIAWSRLKSLIEANSEATIITETDGYLHVEFKTAFFRFVDDVEFLLDAESGRIHFRSASRVGYSDMGLNRRRMEDFRKRFESAAVQRSASPVLQNP